VEIRLENFKEALSERDPLDALFIRPNAFKTAAHLLDELYTNYLAHRYPPFSYGRAWHLRRDSFFSGAIQLAVDWRLLYGRFESKHSPITLMNGSPETYGLVANSDWDVADGMPPDTTVLAVCERWMIETMLQNKKAVYFLMHDYMQEVDVAKFSRTKREFIAVFTNLYGFGGRREEFANKLFVQTKNCPAELKERWTY
jgi:hypothetical protein